MVKPVKFTRDSCCLALDKFLVKRRKILAVSTQLKQLRRSCDLLFDLSSARAPRQTPWRRFQALVGEHAQRQTQLTSESHHRINTCYASIDKVLSELELRFSGNDQEILFALGNIYHSETPDKESLPRC